MDLELIVCEKYGTLVSFHGIIEHQSKYTQHRLWCCVVWCVDTSVSEARAAPIFRIRLVSDDGGRYNSLLQWRTSTITSAPFKICDILCHNPDRQLRTAWSRHYAWAVLEPRITAFNMRGVPLSLFLLHLLLQTAAVTLADSALRQLLQVSLTFAVCQDDSQHVSQQKRPPCNRNPLRPRPP
jgi:hypothetical protein